MNHWLLKSEPATFGIDALAAAPGQTTAWDGVRNFQVRNMLRDSMKKGDLAFFYHSSCAEPGIAGIVRIVKEGYPERGGGAEARRGVDVKSTGKTGPEPRWFAVDVKLVRRFKRIITLGELRKHQTKALSGLLILRRGNRLSVTPVSKKDWDFVLTLE